MPILEVAKVSKIFGGLTAVFDCSFAVKRNAIVSLIGPNGAGKTTTFNMISGLIPPTSGSILFAGTPLDSLKTHQIAKLGIGRSFQNIQLFNESTVLDNLRIGRHCLSRAGIFPSLLRIKSQRIEENEILEKANEFMEFAGLEKYVNTVAMNLPYGDQKRVEIARALMMEPKLLLLDEPNSGMNTQETMELIELIKRINNDLNVTILLISHHMKFVQSISDYIVVLNFGKIIAQGKPQEVIKEDQVIQAYLGRVKYK